MATRPRFGYPRKDHMKAKDVRARIGGFSLMELMIVVVIAGVLAAIAIPTFTTYIYRSRTGEAVSFLGVMKLRQEAFRSEFGAYLQCPSAMDALSDFASDTNFEPDKGAGATPDQALSWTTDACFTQLGSSPDGPVRFRYAWIAGTPAQFAASGIGAALGVTASDHYFVAQAHADLDRDDTWVVFELSNFTRNVWIGNENGTANAQGWE